MYLVYEKNYGLNDVDCVEESEFALFHNKEKALQDMKQRRKMLLEDNPSFDFMEEKSDETCMVIADSQSYGRLKEEEILVDSEIHICLAEISESDLKGKDMVVLLRHVVEWIIQDSSELSEAERKLEEMGFSKEECESLGFPEIINEEDRNDDGKMSALPKNSKLDICRMLTISLDHASHELQMDMRNNGLTDKLGVTVYCYEYGYEICTNPCDTEEEWERWLTNLIDPRLHRMLRIAHEQQCSILRLDEDGSVIEDLPVFAEE